MNWTVLSSLILTSPKPLRPRINPKRKAYRPAPSPLASAGIGSVAKITYDKWGLTRSSKRDAKFILNTFEYGAYIFSVWVPITKHLPELCWLTWFEIAICFSVMSTKVISILMMCAILSTSRTGQSLNCEKERYFSKRDICHPARWFWQC